MVDFEEKTMDDSVISTSRAPSGHPAVSHGRIGVLIVNLGTLRRLATSPFAAT